LKKLIISILMVFAISTAAGAGTIYKVGSVKTSEKNELLNMHLPSDMLVYVGIDAAGNRLTQIRVDTGLELLKLNLWGSSAEYDRWQYIVDKTVEWAEIARKNRVDHNENLDDCSTVDVRCSARFFAFRDGQEAGISFKFESKENQFYKSSPLMLLTDVRALKQILDKTGPAKLDELAQKPRVDTTNLFKK
jgi:hypothetical protein